MKAGMILPVWLVAVGVGALPNAQHVAAHVRGSTGVDPVVLQKADAAVRKVLARDLGAQLMVPPEPFPDAAEHRAQGAVKMEDATDKAGVLETAAAMAAMEAAIKDLEKGAVTPEGIKQLADAHAFGMMACSWNGKNTEAEDHARRALILGGSLKGQTLVTPEDETLFKKVQRSLLSQPRGSLEVKSTPAGAKVTVDGKPAGSTPLTVRDLPPGPHVVQVTAPWREPLNTEVLVPGGGPGTVDATLKELPGWGSMQAVLEKDPLLERAGDWRSVALALGADHALVVAIQADKGGATLSATAHLYNLKDGARRRRAQRTLKVEQLETDVTALVADVLNVADGPGTQGGAQMVQQDAPATATVAAPASSAGGGGGGVMTWLPWVVLAGAVPVALAVGAAGGAAVGILASAYYWQNVLNAEVAAAQSTHARRNAARSTTVGF
jgi:hypothetical protein